MVQPMTAAACALVLLGLVVVVGAALWFVGVVWRVIVPQ
jgi:hypothetical protein